MAAAHGLRSSDVVLMPAPLSHISGLLSGVLIPAAVGMRTIMMERWDPDRAIEVVQDEGVTFMIGPPTFFSAMASAATSPAGPCPPCGLISVRLDDRQPRIRRAHGSSLRGHGQANLRLDRGAHRHHLDVERSSRPGTTDRRESGE